MWNAGLDESQTGIKTARRNVNNLIYADDIIIMAESKEKLKNLLVKVKEENEKADFKLNIQKMKIDHGFWPHLLSLQAIYMGKQWKQWQNLFSWAPKSLQMVTAAMKLRDSCSLVEKLWQI